MKKTVPSGGFRANGFFDGTGFQPEIPCQIRDGVTRLVALVDGRNGNASAGYDGAAERDSRVHHHHPRVPLRSRSRIRVPRERGQLDWQTPGIPLNPLKVDTDDLLHGLLSLARGVDHFAVTLHEEVQPVGLKCLVDQRALNLELLPNIVQCRTDFGQLDAVPAANRSQGVRLHQVDKGQVPTLRIVEVDQRAGTFRLSGNRVQTAKNPATQGLLGHSKVVRRLRYWVRWQETWIVRSVRRHCSFEGHSSPETLSASFVEETRSGCDKRGRRATAPTPNTVHLTQSVVR